MTAQVQKSFTGGGENEDGKAHVCCMHSHFSALKCNYKNYGFFKGVHFHHDDDVV
jgi:hypothetical protein